jgi:hypothetical protein
MAGPQTPRWKWTEVPGFCDPLRAQFPHFDPSDLDLVRWEIMDRVLLDPLLGSNPVFERDGAERYVRLYPSPGLTYLPPLIVAFRIDRLPSTGASGEVTGIIAYAE